MFYVFIVNPTSGNGDAESLLGRIHDACIKRNIDYKVHITSCIGDATNIAESYKHKKDIIMYAVGGDGTLSEVLNGIIGTKNMLALIPAGSGNDFYRTLKLKEDKILNIDVGKLNNRYFINVASIGIDAEVGANAELMKKKGINAKNIYTTAIIYTFLKYKHKILEYKIKNNIKIDKFTMLTICNASYYGGGYHIAPGADLSDGYFDVYFVKKISKVIILPLLLKLKRGTHEESKLIEKKLIKKITLKSKNKIVCCIDGEIIESNKFKFKVIENAVTIYNDKSFVEEILGQYQM
jgi:YegS/Rv2252/BmrU family lipid kinase